MLRQLHDSCPEEHVHRFEFETEEEMHATLAQCEILKENRLRVVKRFPEGILKEFMTTKARRMAKREFKNLGEAWRRGIPSPQPYWIDEDRLEDKSLVLYLFMEDIGDGLTLYDVSRERLLSEEELKELGEICNKLITKGCAHLDLHAGNIVMSEKGMKVVDWGKAHMRSGPLMDGEAFPLLLGVFSSLEPLSDREHLIYLMRALPHMTQNQLQSFFFKLRRARRKVWEKHFFSRARKALEESGSWSRISASPLMICARGLDEEEVKRVLEGEPSELILKEDHKTKLWKEKLGNEEVVVKEFCVGSFWKAIFGQSRCRKSWMSTVQLQARSLPAPKPLAFCEQRDGRGRIVMQSLELARGVDTWIHNNWNKFDQAQCRYWLGQFCLFLEKLFNRNVLPLDLKTCNVMIERKKFYLVDHDGIEFGKVIGQEKKIKAFLQLHLSTPRRVSLVERYRFLRKMTRSKERCREIWLKIETQSVGESILYQGPDGDVSEKQ